MIETAGYLLVIIVILYLCYVLSRQIGKKMNSSMNGRIIKIIERVALGQDKSLIVCAICGSYYLVGVSSQNIKILLQLSEEHFNEEDSPEKLNFMDAIHSIIKANKEKKESKQDQDQ